MPAERDAAEKLTWGDTVRVKESAPTTLRPGAFAAVCGMTDVESTVRAELLGVAIGTTVYLIEFSDGAAVETAGMWLERVDVLADRTPEAARTSSPTMTSSNPPLL